jgi:hypothetical protein
MSKYKVEISAYLDEIFEGEDIDDVEDKVRYDPEIGLKLLRSLQIDYVEQITPMES